MNGRVSAGRGYPPIWTRWVTGQLRIAVAYELTAADPRRGPHLRRLPLTIDARHGDPETYLRRLIRDLSEHVADTDPTARIDRIAAAILGVPGVQVIEPDLQTMLAWQLAQHFTIGPYDNHVADENDDGHECFDPERLAAALVASGVVAPAWSPREMTRRYRELADTSPMTRAASRRSPTRRSTTLGQPALPFQA